MGREIERKFLIRDDGWRADVTHSERLRQGYLVAERERSVRVRVGEAGAEITIKGETRGATRAEYEFAIPRDEGVEILETLCLAPILEKTRHYVKHGSKTWVVDEFHGTVDGLLLAEIELASEDEPVAEPDWVGEEVTGDARFYNANLVRDSQRVIDT